MRAAQLNCFAASQSAIGDRHLACPRQKDSGTLHRLSGSVRGIVPVLDCVCPSKLKAFTRKAR